VIGASFAVDAIRQFVSESVELANQAEGVKRAFDRLNDPQLLSKLQTATAGTVDDLKLMQLAVNAKNFQIPMDVLANGLEFAQRRAVETGQSVDYLVESFVTGLGRESVMVLDNLGIKATDLRKRMAEGGSMADAVGQIMAESFAESGERIMTTSMLIDQQRAEITNLKLAVGEQLQPVYTAFLNEVKGGLNSINTLISDQITGTERMAYIASFFQGAQGKVLRVYLDAQKLARTAIAENEEAQKKLGKETENTNNSTNNLGDAFEKTRNEAFFYTEAIHRLKEAHSMLYKAQGASINQFATATTAFEESKKTWQDNVIQQGLKDGVDLTYLLADAGFDAFTAFDELGNTIGTTLSTSFEAAMISGEDFFKVFIQGLKNMLAQLLAAVAAALVLAALLVVITGGGIGALSMQSIGTAFKHFTGPMMGVPSFGLPGGFGGAMQGGPIQVVGRLSGSDILISNEKANRERSRYTFG